MSCECGCEWEGEDDVVQFCIEEAALITFEALKEQAFEAEQEELNQQAEPAGPKPGEITDPVMADAMAKAKQMHFEQTGVHVP